MDKKNFEAYVNLASAFLAQISDVIAASDENPELINGRLLSLKLLRQPSSELNLRLVLPCCIASPSGELPNSENSKFFFLVTEVEALFSSCEQYRAYLWHAHENGLISLSKNVQKKLRAGKRPDPPYALLNTFCEENYTTRKAIVLLRGNTLDYVSCQNGKPKVNKTILKRLSTYLCQSCCHLLYIPDGTGCSVDKPLYLPLGWCSTKESPYYAASDLRFHSVAEVPDFLKAPRKPFQPVDSGSPWLPLMAYTAFSMLKPFIKAYPSRMSEKMPYRNAVHALEKSFAVTLSGAHALEAAERICGIFMKYGGRFFPEDGKARSLTPRANAIHDGICVFTNVQRWTALKWQKSRLNDYCVLTIESPELLQPDMLHLRLPDAAGIPDRKFSENWECLMAWFLEYILNRWSSVRQGAFSPERIKAEARQKQWRDIQKQHPERVFARPNPPEPLTPLIDTEAAYHDLQQANADRTLRKWYAYLLASWRILLEFQYGQDTASIETAYRQAQRTFLVLSRKKTVNREQTDLVSLFSWYLSDCFERGRILPVRQKPVEDNCCCGWYQKSKGLLYLPFSSYFSSFSMFCAQKGITVPSDIVFHRDVLAPCGIVQGIQNGRKTSYLQYSRQIVVLPGRKRMRVLPVQLSALSCAAPLSRKAQKAVDEL